VLDAVRRLYQDLIFSVQLIGKADGHGATYRRNDGCRRGTHYIVSKRYIREHGQCHQDAYFFAQSVFFAIVGFDTANNTIPHVQPSAAHSQSCTVQNNTMPKRLGRSEEMSLWQAVSTRTSQRRAAHTIHQDKPFATITAAIDGSVPCDSHHRNARAEQR
jgi:hypothetical protein